MNIQDNIKELLESNWFLDTIKVNEAYQRFEDDSPLGFISVMFTFDGDGWITILSELDPEDRNFSMRFRMPMIGGGQSPRVRNALMILAEAIRLDNEDNPQDREF